MKTSRRQVLIIDPSRFMRKLLEIHLSIQGHSGVSFVNYAEALHALPQLRSQAHDLAFVALHALLPESQRVLYALRLHYPDIVIAAMLIKEESSHRAIQKAVQATNAVIFILPFLIQDVLALCDQQRLSQSPGVST